MAVEPTVYVVDDDNQSRASVCLLVRSLGIRAEAFGSAEEFLENYRPGQPGCLVTDVCMRAMSGLELQQQLQERNIALPVIFMTAFAGIPMTVEAMRRGAVTLLEKPLKEDELWQCIRAALQLDLDAREGFELREEYRRHLATLTPAEREVLELVVEGVPNKTIAKRLDRSLRTIEARRGEIFSKLQVDSVAQLVRLVMIAEPPT